MAKHNRYSNNKQKNKAHSRQAQATPMIEPAAAPVKKVPTVYGKPFVLLEDEDLKTLQFLNGAWVSYPKNIAECRLECEVKLLPQKVNRMSRYEVRCPIGTEE